MADNPFIPSNTFPYEMIDFLTSLFIYVKVLCNPNILILTFNFTSSKLLTLRKIKFATKPNYGLNQRTLLICLEKPQ